MSEQYKGLTNKQAKELLKQNGENALKEKNRATASSMFFSQFKDLMILILAVATVISVLMGEGSEAITIIIIVLLNAVMGFIQEFKTEKTLSALKEMSAPLANVLRDDKFIQIDAKQVVCSDIIKLNAGDKIPADAMIIESKSFACDESILTGESENVTKSVNDTVLMGCVVTQGNAIAKVSKTGMDTEMGKIAKMLDNTKEEKTPLQIKLAQLGTFVAIACVTICLIVSFIGYLQGEKILEMLLTGVSLSVAAIPEGMPAIVTIVLALSVGRILKKGAIIRKLHAVETLGCAGVICSDKTGTITENKMTVKQVYINNQNIDVVDNNECRAKFISNGIAINPLENDIFTRLLDCGIICNNSEIIVKNNTTTVTGNPTEGAALSLAIKSGVNINATRQKSQKLDETPFDSKLKYMTVTSQYKNQKTIFIKGAPDILLDKCKNIAIKGSSRQITKNDKQEIITVCKNMAHNALRLLAFAQGDSLQNLTFLGVVGIIDPPRKEVERAVKRARKAGIKPVMITGDFADTAIAIAKQVSIHHTNDMVLTGDDLDKMTDSELASICMKTSVYARVSPSHKLKIVNAYKACGQVVAMTGDGVNDAPAVKQADIGVAMNAGTDVTKEAAQIVILDNNFATIVSAVEEGRIIYQNIRRFIRYLLTGNLGEVLSMLFAMLLNLPIPLVPIQILMMNLLTDGLPAIALGMDPPSYDIMRAKPRPKNQGLFANGLMAIILFRGVLLAVATVGAYSVVYKMGATLEVSRSAAFLTLVLSQMVHIYECRGSGVNFKGNPYLLFSTLISAALVMSSVYLPLLQPIFKTTAVTGKYLLPVICGIFLGPVIMFVLKCFKRIFTRR